MVFEKRISFAPQQIIVFGGIIITYTTLGVPFPAPLKQINFFNLTDAILFFSLDGVTDQFTVPINSGIIIQANKMGRKVENISFRENQQLFVRHKGAAPSSGIIVIEEVFVT